MTPTTPAFDEKSLEIAGIEPPADYPVGLNATLPDDLGDWWLDLGTVDLPTLSV